MGQASVAGIQSYLEASEGLQRESERQTGPSIESDLTASKIQTTKEVGKNKAIAGQARSQPLGKR